MIADKHRYKYSFNYLQHNLELQDASLFTYFAESHYIYLIINNICTYPCLSASICGHKNRFIMEA